MSWKVCLSPSNQTENAYAYGNTTEAEQCGIIALACKAALIRHGIEVICPHLDGMAEKIRQSDAFGADLHVPIHTNAFNGEVTGTRGFCSKFGTEGYRAIKCIFDYLAPLTPGTSENIKEYPTLYEMKSKAWTAYVECTFHDNPDEAKWIIEHTTEIGEAIAHGIVDWFGLDWIPAGEVEPAPAEKIRYRVQVGSFAKKTNAERLMAEMKANGYDAYIVTVKL